MSGLFSLVINLFGTLMIFRKVYCFDILEKKMPMTKKACKEMIWCVFFGDFWIASFEPDIVISIIQFLNINTVRLNIRLPP